MNFQILSKFVISRFFGQRVFVRNVGWLLCVTGFAKVMSFFGHAPVFRLHEPILQIPFRELFIVVGIVELGAAAFCLNSKRLNRSMLIIAWLSTSFLVYRLSLAWVGWHLPCPCLGSLVEILHVSPALADLAMIAIMAYMLAGSYVHVLRYWLAKGNETNSVDVKSILQK